MRKPITIGENFFKTKNEALLFYKDILNRYLFGDVLNNEDKELIIDLIDYDDSFEEIQTINKVELVQNLFIENIKIGKAQYNTKCFEIVWNDDL